MTFPTKGILLDILKGIIATVALFLAYVTLPLFGMLGGMLAPLPVVYYTLRIGRVPAAIIILASAGLLAAVADPSAAGVYLAQAASVSLLLPLFVETGSTARTIVLTTAGSLAFMLVAGILFTVSRGINLDAEVLKWLSAGIAQTASLYSKSGLKESELQSLQQGLQQAGALMGRIYPAMLAISQAGIVMANMMAVAGFARRGHLQVTIGEFREFRNVDQLIWLLITAGFAMMLDNDMVTRVALNVLLVVLFAYFFQGLAVISNFFTRFNVPPFGRFFFYLFLLLQPYLLAGIAALGIFDMWGNFRTPKQQNL